MKIWKTRETMFIFKLHSAELHTFWRDILAWFSNWFRESILDLWDPAASKEIHFCNNSNLRKSCWRKVLHLLSNLRLSKRNNLHHNSRVNSKLRKGFSRGRWPSCTTISVLSMRTSFFRPPLSRDKLHESMYLWFFTIFRVFFCHLEKRFESRFRSPSWTTKRKNFFVLKYNLQDRVLVEAAFNANMPFKWNATRIQVLPNQNSNKPGMNPNSSTSVTSTSTLNAHAFANPSNAPQIQTHQPPPPVQQRMNHNRNEAAFGSGNGASNSRNEHGGGRNNESRMRQPSPPVRDLKRMSSNNDHRNRRDDRSNTRDRSDGGRDNRDRSRDKDRSNSRASPPTLSRKRSRSPRRTRSRSRSRSPPRRRVRIAPRYNVSVPKVSLNFPDR